MYNWRLLLLALVAIFQPITSFTERNLVNGRQECCGHETDSLLRASKSSLHGTYRVTKETFHRVTDRGDSREDRRYEPRQRDTVLSRGHTNRYHPDIKNEPGLRYFITTRSDPVEYRSESATNDKYRYRRLDVQRRVRDATNFGALEVEDQYRRNLNRITRGSTLRHDDRIHVLSSRHILSRDEIPISRLRNSYQEPRNVDSRRELLQFGSGDQRRLTSIRDTRNTVRHLRENVIEVSNDNRQRNAGLRIMTVRRESVIRDDLRNYKVGQRRDKTQRLDERRSLSGNVVVERNYNIRENSRNEWHENRNRNPSSRRLISERIEGNRELKQDIRLFREQLKENTDRKLSGERMKLDQNVIRDSRQNNPPSSRTIESRRNIRYHDKLSTTYRGDRLVRENRVDSGRSRQMDSLERDNHAADRRARSLENRGVNNIRDETDSKLHRTNEVMQGHDESRRQIKYRNKMEDRERDTYDARSRNIEGLARHRELIFNKVESETGINNWQYMLYTLQAVYLCGLLVQLLTPSYSKKSSFINVHWWPSSSQERIKVD